MADLAGWQKKWEIGQVRARVCVSTRKCDTREMNEMRHRRTKCGTRLHERLGSVHLVCEPYRTWAGPADHALSLAESFAASE